MKKDLQTENSVVKECLDAVRKDLKGIVESKKGEFKTCGIRYWDRAIELDSNTGSWAKKGMFSKPSRWLFTHDGTGEPLDFTDRIAYFSLRNEALAFAVRAVPVFKNEELSTFQFIEHTEWIVIFIAKSLTPRGSSSATAHSSRLDEGLITITTDDREFEVPLECIGLIKPQDMMSSPLINEVHASFEKALSASTKCYDLNEEESRVEFLKRVDKLQVSPSNSHASTEASWMSEDDFNQVISLFGDADSNLMLWGNDESSLLATTARIEQSSEQNFVHIEALPNWNENTLPIILSSIDASTKVVCIHRAERIAPELVLPGVFNKNKIPLISAAGKFLPKSRDLPLAWIFVANGLSPGQIKEWHRALSKDLKWFRCEAAMPSIEAVKRIYKEENVQSAATNWFDNLFVIMWDEMVAHLPISTEALAAIVRNCLRKDSTGTWDLEASAIQKKILVREIESESSSLIASMEVERRKQCVNALIATLEIPNSQGHRLLSLVKALS
ncbi:hypothetical protein KUL17_25520 [Alteromonas sp. KUL17]|uniref:hypothetical protein n=1 Tax=Alteromonas sp. KUL17 TaxID=2480796 RepID=UPI0010375B22|nr:hypothetical protein [Alteromonas sp. KUL17]TAP25377.1 hypothetical protein KUL49_12725 [Alteromonas sp. KUL17]GEA03655.1 hypothetical protein KUL17_25520 [Alteromonas sp. KUL17]